MNTCKQASLSLLAVVLLLVLGLSVCDPVPWVRWLVARSCSDVEKEFFRKSGPERRRLILDYPLEQQVNLYLKSFHCRHPGDLSLSGVVASNGADIVPILRDRIIEIDSEHHKSVLVGIFFDMQFSGYYPVASDTETMNFLEQQAALMEDTVWRELTVRDIMLIKKKGGLRPSEVAQ